MSARTVWGKLQTISLHRRRNRRRRRHIRFPRSRRYRFRCPLRHHSRLITYYFFVYTGQMGLKSMNLCDKLLSRYKVAAVPGIAFGYDKGIRLSYCTTLDVLNEGLTRFEQFCREH